LKELIFLLIAEAALPPPLSPRRGGIGGKFKRPLSLFLTLKLFPRDAALQRAAMDNSDFIHYTGHSFNRMFIL